MTDCQSCFDRQGVIEWRGVQWCPACFEIGAQNRGANADWIKRVLGVVDDGGFSPPLDAVAVDFGSRSRYLQESTVLSLRRAEVQALRERCLTRTEIAERLDISANTVDEHRQEIKGAIERAERTVELFSE